MANTTTKQDGWRMMMLGKLCKKIGSGATPTGGQESYKTDGVALIRSQNILDFDFSYKGLAYIDDQQASDLSNVEVQENDVLINITGDSVARVCMTPKAVLPARVNQHVAILRPDPELLSSIYLKYSLLNPIFKRYLLILANSGGTRNALTKGGLENLEILTPSLPEQCAIATVLSSLDNKIDLLRKQNKILEDTAQTIFRESFGKYQVGDDLPEDWKVGKVANLIDILSGFAFKSSDFVSNGKYGLVTIRNVQDGSFVQDTKDKLNTIPSKTPDYCRLKTGDILLSLTGNVGRVCHVIGMNYLLNQRVAKLQAKNKKDFAFVYLFFRQGSMIDLLENISAGTAQQNLSPIKTGEIEIVIPSRQKLDQFAETTKPLIEKILSSLSQIQILSTLRDTLLPRLMSGELRAKNFNSFIP